MTLSSQQQALWVNQEIKKRGLVPLTWGTGSVRNKKNNSFFIKPSGVNYDSLTATDMVEISLETGKVLSGKLKPSIDTPIHLSIYRAWTDVGSIVHTHSRYAAAFAIARVPIPYTSTTMADYFSGNIPVTSELSSEEIESAYEENLGRLIVKTFIDQNIDHMEIPAILHSTHGPFTWGRTPEEAVDHATAIEEVAAMNIIATNLNAEFTTINNSLQTLLKYHNDRHTGKLSKGKRSYGQKK